MLIRSVGPCKRCPAVQVNYDTHGKNPEMEPQLTLNTFRKHPDTGDVFGMYYQMEHLATSYFFNWAITNGDYDVAMKRHPEIDSNFVRVEVGDRLEVRLREKQPWKYRLNSK